MARAKQSEKNNVTPNEIDFSKDIGLTTYKDVEHSAVMNRFPTMIPQLDYILGGGLPFGRMVEILGKNASGKSSYAVAMTRICQWLEIPCVWIDVEGTADPVRLAELGVDFSAGGVYMVEPDKKKNEIMTIELVAKKLEAVVGAFSKSGEPLVIIWDSVAQTPAQTEIDRGVGDKQPGLVAKSLTQFSKIIAPLMNDAQVLFIAINQARDEMGSMFGGIDSPGGNSLHHWASLRLEVAKASQIKDKEVNAFGVEEETYVGHIMRIKTIKSKVSRPNQKAEMFLMADSGLDIEQNIYRSAHAPNKQYGLISGGAWRKYTTLAGENIQFNSDKNWIAYLKSPEGQEVRDELFCRMMATSFPNGYAPFNNKQVDVTQIPLYAKAKAFMETHRAEQATTEPTAETETPNGVQDLLDQV